jgi:hypothetical protein
MDDSRSSFFSSFFAVILTTGAVVFVRLFFSGDLMDTLSPNKQTFISLSVVTAFALVLPVIVLCCLAVIKKVLKLDRMLSRGIPFRILWYVFLGGMLFAWGYTSSISTSWYAIRVTYGMAAVFMFGASAALLSLIGRNLKPAVRVAAVGIAMACWVLSLGYLVSLNTDYLNRPFPGEYQWSSLKSNNVLVIGIDGLDWRITNAMMESGRLPNLKGLAESGSFAPLHTLKPTSSPFIWNAIYTGYMPETHQLRPSVISLPLNTIYKRNHSSIPDPLQFGALILLPHNRKTTHYPLSFWEILARGGYATAVLGTWEKTPVSRRGMANMTVSRYSPFDLDRMNLDKDYFDEQLHEHVDSINIRQDRIPREEWSVFTVSGGIPDGLHEALGGDQADPASERLARFRRIYATDRFRVHLGKKILSTIPDPFCVMLYIQGTDQVSHYFLGLQEGRVTAEAESELSQIVEKYYQKADEWVGELLAAAPSKTTVVVVSDHGFDPGLAQPDHPYSTGFHSFAPDGIFIASGGNVPNGDLDRVHVLDVAPTILYLTGMPEPANVQGRPAFMTDTYNDLIQDWYSMEKRSLDTGDPKMRDMETMKKLKALGYVE